MNDYLDIQRERFGDRLTVHSPSTGALMQGVDAFLLGRRTYATHAAAFEPMLPGDLFGDLMNAPRKYVVSRTLERLTWRNSPVRQLEGFRRVTLQPGETRTLHFSLHRDELQFWSPRTKSWVVEPSTFDVWVGEDSAADLHGELTIEP